MKEKFQMHCKWLYFNYNQIYPCWWGACPGSGEFCLLWTGLIHQVEAGEGTGLLWSWELIPERESNFASINHMDILYLTHRYSDIVLHFPAQQSVRVDWLLTDNCPPEIPSNPVISQYIQLVTKMNRWFTNWISIGRVKKKWIFHSGMVDLQPDFVFIWTIYKSLEVTKSVFRKFLVFL